MDPPVSAVHVNKALVAANRVMAGVHLALVAAFIARRTTLPSGSGSGAGDVVMVLADLTLLFLWSLSQAGLWRPVRRAAFPDRLLKAAARRGGGGTLACGLDVLVVTADPDKEPALGVVNTVVSAMALDYPPGGGRLSVYLSDDAGSPLTLLAARKAYAFARAWVPFCRKHSVQCPWPDRYFLAGDVDGDHDRELAEDRTRIKEMYETLKRDLEEASKDESVLGSWTRAKRLDHDAYVEIMGNEEESSSSSSSMAVPVPLLVYVSREKRACWAHHFKAGALNALLRVSSLLTNAAYLLVLDCDMSCNSRSSALEAMCFFFHQHRDRPPPPPLAFVQFPQMFHNLSANDIYTNDLRYIFHTRWFGLDGLRGPILSGTGFYARRDALYGATPHNGACLSSNDDDDDAELKRRFGQSDRLAASVKRTLHHQQQQQPQHAAVDSAELVAVASCAYEAGTGWGDRVGFMYQSVVEDYFTGYRRLFAAGWTSAYYSPPPNRPAFLGTMPTNLNDVLVQNKRWMSGMLAVGLSRYCPLACRQLLAASVPHAMGIAYFAFAALYAFPALCYATLPQLRFLRGATLFAGGLRPLAAACFASSLMQHLVEVSVARRGRLPALRTFWNEQRFWMLNAVTAQLFACASAVQERLGAGAIDFDLTSKADDGAAKLYQAGVFDFTGCSTLLLPATTLCVLNAAALVGGTWRMAMTTSGAGGGLAVALPAELFLLCYIAALSYPLLEGMFIRRDPARVQPRITALSVALAAGMLAVLA